MTTLEEIMNSAAAHGAAPKQDVKADAGVSIDNQTIIVVFRNQYGSVAGPTNPHSSC